MQIRYFLAMSLFPTLVLADNSAAVPSSSSVCIIEPNLPRQIPTSPSSAIQDPSEVTITSNDSQAQLGQKAIFNGNVSFIQGSRSIAANEAIVDQQQQSLSANGDLVFSDSSFIVTADSLVAQMRSNTATLQGTSYWLKGQQAHGTAGTLEITKENNLILSQATITTCPDPQPDWVLEANKIKIDSTEEWGEIWGAKLRVADIPVFYLPYMTIPVSNKRKSGFLFPSFSSSTRNGLEFTVPYYWNIAPEYDLTLTPNYMSSRGLYTKSEFRYLAGSDSSPQSGQINLEYLGNDQYKNYNSDRYLYHWQQQGSIGQNWRVMANYTDVSDDNYFNDLSSNISTASNNQLIRVGEASYLEENWDLTTKVQDIKVLGESDQPYQVMPQLDYNYRAPDVIKGVDFDLFSEASQFKDQNSGNYSSATRVHLEPSLAYPIQGPAGSLTTELKLLQTNYSQQDNTNSGLSDSVSRTLPEARISGQINFERYTNYFNQNYRQTLTPQFQYLYIGYQDQSDIGIYDTAELQNDYYGLFRDKRYSGLDRIADANQMTVGITTKLFNTQNREIFKFSLGQIIYFQDSRVISEYSNTTNTATTSSTLASDLSAQLYNDWFISGSVQYNTQDNSNTKNEVSLDYRPAPNKLLQVSYRYVPDLVNTNTGVTSDISQTGFRGSWPITDNISLVGNWYYDLSEKQSVETYTGFQYDTCCWAIRVTYHDRIKTSYSNDTSSAYFQSGVYVNFIINGLGGSTTSSSSSSSGSSSGGSLDAASMLNDGLFNYRSPIYLNN
ncbi:LPS assembly protein LptD [uncultured Shewanella sp.]|uniref:LPS assembly protein LptD n=1 Tax=uncultured Shewanella sp. TaxID=173975 RepID=UPI00261A09F2|nr:LPS assembly protein LptD [uncultured Shewanella sp.]